MANFVVGSCVGGGASAIDCDIFGEKVNPDEFLNSISISSNSKLSYSQYHNYQLNFQASTTKPI